MSNNAAVTADGGEIGRAQALQARACGIAPTTDMNPVLLKPQSETGAQVVVQGRVVGSCGARDYAGLKATLLPRVIESFERLSRGADIVLVEGAGSPAEINLRDGDIANMGFAEAADVPVVLVGDIERGGVIASLVGTYELLQPSERQRLRGYIVNKFRGDPRLFADGIRALTERIALPCIGLVPFFPAARDLPAEDSVALDHAPRPRGDGRFRIAVPRLPRIANFDDLDPLALEPDVALDIVPPGRPLPADADLVLLPGSKATLADLAALRAEGWDIDIRAHARRGGRVLGLCGGYQMLGRRIADPQGIEGPPGEAAGLGLRAVETVLTGSKVQTEAAGRDALTGAPLAGYEMHVGETDGPDCARSFALLGDGRPDGARSADGRIAGSYLHGIFAADEFRRAYLAALGAAPAADLVYKQRVERALDALAEHLEAHVDIGWLVAIARER
jgi:adenosylcobyric acid synthase